MQNNTVGVDSLISNFQSINMKHQIQSLQCLFTWEVKSQGNQDMITCIKNKYGDANLDISLPEFTFVKFIGNLIISHELYLNGDTYASETKILEMGKWLDQLDKTNDEFYLSINIALKHIRTANFIHMLFVSNQTTGFNMLLDETVPFDVMDNKLKAAVYSIHAVILLEYGIILKNHNFAKRACDLDPDTSHWWHIYACILSRGHCIFEKRLYLNTEIIKTVRRAVLTSDKINTSSVDSFVLATLNQVIVKKYQTSIFESMNNSEYTTTTDARLDLSKEMMLVVKKHKNGEDVLPHLNNLILKFKHDKWKIIAEICSYTVLFRNKFQIGIELFLVLIKEPNMPTSNLIRCRSSIFIDNSKIFNLDELIWNEVIVAITNLKEITPKDILFYYKVFIEMKETYNLKIRADLSMRTDLIDILPYNSKFSPNKTNSPKKKEFINKSVNIIDNNRSNFQMQVGLINEESKSTLAYLQQSSNIFNEIKHLAMYKYYGFYECLPSPSAIEKINLFFKSTFELSSTASKIILTDIDTSLTIFPRTLTSPEVYRYHLQIILNKYPNSLSIYTDASRIQNNVGIAIVSVKEYYCYKLSSEYSSSEAEAVAILRALDYAFSESLNEYVILSDSLSTIKCIQNKIVNSDVINSILCLIHAHQLKQNIVHFVWIPSHKSIEGNEKADKLAKEIAVSTTVITYSHNSYMPKNVPTN